MADNFGPNNVYANIPRTDSHGRAQPPMFLRWNSDPVGNDASNLASLNSNLQKVVAQARADNPNLHFVIGSGKRSAADQDLAKSWGWSKVGSKDGGDSAVHMQGNAVDLWGLDSNGRVQFNPEQQKQISQAMQAAAAKLGVGVNWGGNFKTFKDAPHFELAGGGSAEAAGGTESPHADVATATTTAPAAASAAPTPVGTTVNSMPTTVTASTPFSLSSPASKIPSAGQYQPLIDAAAKKYGLDPNFLDRVLWQENRFRPEGTSTAGAQGIAQFMPATAERYGVDVHDPASSIEGAAHYLSDLSGRYSGNLGLAAAGYNWGEGNVDKWLQGKSKAPSETTNYVSTITGHSMDEWRADPKLPLGSTGPGRSPSGPAAPAAPAAPPNPFTAFAPGGAAAPGGAVASSLTDLDKALGGQQPGQKQQGGQALDMQASPMIQGPGAVNVSPLFNPMLGQQMMAQLSRAPARPAQQEPMGTTLNSLAALDASPVQFPQVYPSQMGYGGMGSMSMGGYPSSGGYGYGG